VFCREPRKITLEHMIPTWMTSGEDSSSHLYVRESGGPDYEPRQHIREGRARDLAAKGPCERCNSGWMNDMDHGVLDVLGPQLIKGKKVKLTKAKKALLAAWTVKYVLMNQLTHERSRRFAITDCEYARTSHNLGTHWAWRRASWIPIENRGQRLEGLLDRPSNTRHNPSVTARGDYGHELVMYVCQQSLATHLVNDLLYLLMPDLCAVLTVAVAALQRVLFGIHQDDLAERSAVIVGSCLE
jgi:hypothetical protein